MINSVIFYQNEKHMKHDDSKSNKMSKLLDYNQL